MESRPNKYKFLGRICALAIVVAYFLPWIDVMLFRFSGMELSGMYNKIQKLQDNVMPFVNAMAEGMGEEAPTVEKISKPLWIYGTMLFPVVGIASAILNKKLLHLLSGVFVLIIILWAVIDMKSSFGEIGDEVSVLQVISIGLLITIIAPFGQIFGAFTCEDKRVEIGSTQPYEIRRDF